MYRRVLGALAALVALLAASGCTGPGGRLTQGLASALGDFGLRDVTYADARSSADMVTLSRVRAIDAAGRPVSIAEVTASRFEPGTDGWSAASLSAREVRSDRASAEALELSGVSRRGTGGRPVAHFRAVGVRTTLHGVPVEVPSAEGQVTGEGLFRAAFQGLAAGGDGWNGALVVGPGGPGEVVVSLGPAVSGRGGFEGEARLSGTTPAAVAGYLLSPDAGAVAPGDLRRVSLRAALSSLPSWVPAPDPSRFQDPAMRALASAVAGGSVQGDVALAPPASIRLSDLAAAAARPDAYRALGVIVGPGSVPREVAEALADALAPPPVQPGAPRTP